MSSLPACCRQSLLSSSRYDLTLCVPLKKSLEKIIFLLFSPKVLTDVDPFVVMTVRAVVIISLSGPIALIVHMKRKRRKMREKKGTSEERPEKMSKRKIGLLLFLRGAIMSTGVCLAYYAMRNMPLGRKLSTSIIIMLLSLQLQKIPSLIELLLTGISGFF